MEFDIVNGKLIKFRNEYTVIIPKGVEVIGCNSFFRCKEVRIVVIPEGVKKIESEAFWGCENLVDVILPDGLEEILSDAFGWCENLTAIIIPDSIKFISETAFSGCPCEFKLVAHEGSYAERYAKENGFDFKERKDEDSSM